MNSSSNHRRRDLHVQERSEMLRNGGEELLFRARCSCGWRSEPVGMGLVYIAWEDHRTQATDGASTSSEDADR